MRRDDYWNLFWLSGLPEAWMMSRPTEGYLFPPEMVMKDLPHPKEPLPEEVRQMRESQPGELS